MANRFRLSVGEITVECEGTEEFIREALETLVPRASDALKDVKQHHPASVLGAGAKTKPTTANSVDHQLLSTSIVASKIKCESGTGLIKAAAVKLTAADKIQTFTRQQILESMKTATAFYRETYSGNLSKYLNQLSRDGALNEVGAGMYALSASALNEAKSALEGEHG